MWPTLIGLAGFVAVALAGYGLSYRAIGRANRDSDRADAKERELDAKATAFEVNERSIVALRTEIANLKTASNVLDAKLAIAERQRDDLLHTIETTPAGASSVAAALRIELDRMRKLSATATAATTGDSSGAEAGILHGDTAVDPPKP
jgi:phage shock protein A